MKKFYSLMVVFLLMPTISFAGVINENYWNSLTGAGWWVTPTSRGVLSSITCSSDPYCGSAPNSSKVLRIEYTAPFTNKGSSPGSTGTNVNAPELYVQYYIKYSSNFVNQITVTKHYYLTNIVSASAGAPDSNNILIVGMTGSGKPRVSIAGGVGNWEQNVDTANTFRFQHGVWYKVKTYQHVNTNGSNGAFKMWINDRLIINYTGLPFRISSNFGGTNVFEGFKYDMVYGGANPSVPDTTEDMWVYIANTMLSTTDILGSTDYSGENTDKIPAPPGILSIQ
jgi:hypothetical protein